VNKDDYNNKIDRLHPYLYFIVCLIS